MNWLGYREVALKSIVADQVDIRRRTALKAVQELAEDATEHGGEYIHAPTAPYA